MISKITARVYVHATEDKDKVMRALMNVFPEHVKDKISVREERYEGHYGNPIVVLEAVIDDPKAAEEAFKGILDKLDDVDRRYLAASLDDRVDKSGSLYLRISKQHAYKGELKILESDDVIKVIVSFRGGRRKALREFHRVIAGD